MAGLYDLVREHFHASSERKKEIEAERAERFPFIEGWPQHPYMIYVEVAPDVWAWSLPTIGARYVDNNGNTGGGDGQEVKLFNGPFARLKGDKSYAHPAADFLRLTYALTFWPQRWGNAFHVEIFGSFQLRDVVVFEELGVIINGRHQFGQSNFGARWFYSARVTVQSRDLDGFLDGIERLERALGVLHVASIRFSTNLGPGVAIQYRCRFLEFEVWGFELSDSDGRTTNITGSRSLAQTISKDIAALQTPAATLVWRAIWWIRHARDDKFTGQQNPSLFLIYLSYWNALECLIEAVNKLKPPPKLTKNEKNDAIAAYFEKLESSPTTEDVQKCYHELVNPGIKSRARHAFNFAENVFPEFDASGVFDMCFNRKPLDERLYAMRNDIDHGNIVEFNLITRQRVQKCLEDLSSIVLRLLNAVVIGKP